MKKLFCTLALLMAVTSIFARADTFEVGRKTIIVPVPQGFFRVAEDHMAALKSFTDSFVDPANDTLAYYILESDVPAAMAGEIPLLDRYFILKVNKQVRNLTVGKNDFAEFKKLIREQNKALLEGATSRARESLRKTGENITQEFAINLAVELNQVVPLPPHYEEENAIAFSMFVNYGVTSEGVETETNIVSGTFTTLNVSGRVLSLNSYGQQEDLEWTRTASRDWGKRVMESNTQPPPESPSGRRFDWNEIMGKGLVGALAGGLVALIAMVFRRYFWRR